MESSKIIFFLLLISSLGNAQVKVLERAHAHNDYEHKRPLFDALSFGFNSVEADVHLIKNELCVSHTTPIFNKAKTLEQLYLKPLDSLIKTNGSVYKNSSTPFFLMIDFKTEADQTYDKLMEILNPFSHLVAGENPSVIIFISGNRPVETIKNDKRQWVALDGRPAELGKGFDNKIMPVVSIDFKSLSKWNGTSEIPQKDFNTIQSLAKEAHNENKKLRLWGIPDLPRAWKTLSEAGVDLINTDRLKELSDFLNSYPNGN